MDETEIIMRMQSGDMEAFDQIFKLYKDKLMRMAFLISGNYADSEDIVQETFVKCYRHRRSLKDVGRFSSWLYQILTRTAWKYCKKQSREKPVGEVFDEAVPSGEPLPLEQVIVREQQQILYKEIEALEIRQRTVVILYYFNQFSTGEIARIMNCMEGTVKSRLYKARKNLEKALEEKAWKEEALAWKKKSLIL